MRSQAEVTKQHHQPRINYSKITEILYMQKSDFIGIIFSALLWDLSKFSTISVCAV